MTDEQRNPKLVVRFAGYAIMLLVPLLLIVALETAGLIFLKSQGQASYPILINRQAEDSTYADVFDTRIWMSTLDPHLSHTHSADAFEGKRKIPGFVIYGAQDEDSALRIVALGGSTTDPLTEGNWPEQLEEILKANGVEAQVYNGGVAGYSSNQELLKLIRDVLPLKPDIVISLSGINDLGGLHSVKGHPMVHPYQHKILKAIANRTEKPSWLLPNAVAAARSLTATPESTKIDVGYGPIVRTSPAKQWLLNQRLMHAVTEECGIKFLGILQPTMGVGTYDPTVAEQEMLNKAVKKAAWKGDYVEFVRAFYREAHPELQNMPFCISLVDVFQDEHNMYRDARHQNREGCKVLATEIFEELDSRGMLPVAP